MKDRKTPHRYVNFETQTCKVFYVSTQTRASARVDAFHMRNCLGWLRLGWLKIYQITLE